jgi:hypothetical protein
MVLDVIISGASGYDEALATNGNDSIIFDPSSNTQHSQLQSSPLADAILLLGGDDEVLDGNEGRLYYGNMGSDRMSGRGGSDTLVGGQDFDFLHGNEGNDFLFGNMGQDLLRGYTGNDLIRGGQDDDSLRGGDGDDTLYGDLGFDTLTGNAGSDVLIGGSNYDVFTLSDESGSDIIADFEDGIDQIELPENISISDVEIVPLENGSTGIFLASSGELLAAINGVASSAISGDDFIGEVSTTPTSPGIANPTQVVDVSIGDGSMGFISDSYDFEGSVGVSNPADYYRLNIASTDSLLAADGAQVNIELDDGQIPNGLNLPEKDLDYAVFADFNGDGNFTNDEIADSSWDIDDRGSDIDIGGLKFAPGSYLLQIFPDSRFFENSDGDISYDLSLNSASLLTPPNGLVEIVA